MKPFFHPEFGPTGVFMGASMLFFGIVGFDFLSMIAEEAKNSSRDVPLAMRDCVTISTVCYVLVGISMCGIGLGRTANFSPSTAIADQFKFVGLGFMTITIYFCACIGITACCFTTVVGLARLQKSLANEGFLPEFFSGKDSPNGISV